MKKGLIYHRPFPSWEFRYCCRDYCLNVCLSLRNHDCIHLTFFLINFGWKREWLDIGLFLPRVFGYCCRALCSNTCLHLKSIRLIELSFSPLRDSKNLFRNEYALSISTQNKQMIQYIHERATSKGLIAQMRSKYYSLKSIN